MRLVELVYSDDAFATMLLMSSIVADKEELVRPLSASEYYRLRAETERSPIVSLGRMIGMDLSGVKRALNVTEKEAYRICVLLSRAMPLSYALEQFDEACIRIVTVDETHYPARLLRRLHDQAPPMLYVCGSLPLIAQPGIALVGEAGRHGMADCARRLAREARDSGFALFAGDEPGAGRIAEAEALEGGGRYVLFLAGAMSGRIYQPGVSEMIIERRALALSVVHPDAQYTHAHALERNRCLYALADAAFVLAAGQEKGVLCASASAAMRNGWIDHLYALDDAALPGNRRLMERGAGRFKLDEAVDLKKMRSQWREPSYEQISLLD